MSHNLHPYFKHQNICLSSLQVWCEALGMGVNEKLAEMKNSSLIVGGETLTPRDLATLNKDQWVNDKVILACLLYKRLIMVIPYKILRHVLKYPL